MRETFLNEMMIFAVASLVMCIPIWLLLWIIFPRLDRRPKDSVRCRKCWYDLRATRTDHCPECGADLNKTKVWPIGKPSRGKLIHLLMLWFWLGFLGTTVASNLCSNYKDDLIKHYTIDQTVVILGQPTSATHDAAFITLSGQRWVTLPTTHDDLRIPVSWASIHIYSAGEDVLSVTIDLETMTYMPHPLAYVENTQADIRRASRVDLPYGQTVTAEGLAQFHPLGLSQETDRLLIEEMSLLIVALEHPKTKTPLLLSLKETQDFANDLRPLADAGGTYGITKGLEDFYDYDTKQVPMWTAYIVLGMGVLVILIGVILIRRWCYARDLARWEPAVESQPE